MWHFAKNLLVFSRDLLMLTTPRTFKRQSMDL
jgi:hypothetical protein